MKCFFTFITVCCFLNQLITHNIHLLSFYNARCCILMKTINNFKLKNRRRKIKLKRHFWNSKHVKKVIWKFVVWQYWHGTYCFELCILESEKVSHFFLGGGEQIFGEFKSSYLRITLRQNNALSSFSHFKSCKNSKNIENKK